MSTVLDSVRTFFHNLLPNNQPKRDTQTYQKYQFLYANAKGTASMTDLMTKAGRCRLVGEKVIATIRSMADERTSLVATDKATFKLLCSVMDTEVLPYVDQKCKDALKKAFNDIAPTTEARIERQEAREARHNKTVEACKASAEKRANTAALSEEEKTQANKTLDWNVRDDLRKLENKFLEGETHAKEELVNQLHQLFCTTLKDCDNKDLVLQGLVKMEKRNLLAALSKLNALDETTVGNLNELLTPKQVLDNKNYLNHRLVGVLLSTAVEAHYDLQHLNKTINDLAALRDAKVEQDLAINKLSEKLSRGSTI